MLNYKLIPHKFESVFGEDAHEEFIDELINEGHDFRLTIIDMSKHFPCTNDERFDRMMIEILLAYGNNIVDEEEEDVEEFIIEIMSEEGYGVEITEFIKDHNISDLAVPFVNINSSTYAPLRWVNGLKMILIKDYKTRNEY